MGKLTRVVNLKTGEERFYSLSPREAVAAAWRQERGDWNTWDYGGEPVQEEEEATSTDEKLEKLLKGEPVIVSEGRRSVSCGEWCALKR